MFKQVPWRLAAVPLSCSLILAVGGPGRSQAPPTGADPFKVPDRLEPVQVAPPAKPAPRSVDDLLAQLAKVRQQRAELAKQEKALVEELRARHRALTDSLTKLGVLPLPAPPSPPKEVLLPALDIPVAPPVVGEPTGVQGGVPPKSPSLPK